MAKLTQLTEEQHEDLKRLAKALDTIEKQNRIVKTIGSKYIGFVDEYEDQLRRGITVDGIMLNLKVTRKLLAEEV